jgi:tyrosine-protein kinase Etk/Wzc
MFQDEEDGLDLKKYIFKALDNWYWILISVVLALSIAFLINRYTTNYYLVKGTILINDKKNDLGSSVLDEMDLFSSQSNIENEKAILTSYTLMRSVVDSLELYIELNIQGNLKSSKLFDSERPFSIRLLSNPDDLSKEDFEITVSGPEKLLLNRANTRDLTDAVSYTYGDTLQFKELIFCIEQEPSVSINRNASFILSFTNPEKLTKKLIKQIKINNLNKGASILEISQEATNTIESIALIRRLMDYYIQRELNLKNETATRTITFINGQLQGIQKELFSAESKLENFRTSNKILDISQEGVGVYNRLQELEQRISELGLHLNYYDYLTDYLKKQDISGSIVSPTLAGIEDKVLNNLILDLNGLYSQQIRLQSSASEINPQVKMINTQIRSLINAIIETTANLINTTQLVKHDLQLRLASAEQELNTLPANERQLLNIQRSFHLNNDLYMYLQEKLAEASIAKASAVANSQIIDPPLIYEQTKPKNLINYGIGFLLGLLFPIMLVVLKDYFTFSIQNVQEVENMIKTPILSLVGLSKHQSELVMHEKPRSSIAEGFRVLRSSLPYLSEKPIQTILLTSFSSGEGKTFNAINTAIMLAKTGKKTLLLGLDLRKPKIFEAFKVTNAAGVSNVLVGAKKWQDVVHVTEVDHLDFIAAGPVPPNPNELLVRETFRLLMDELKKSYEYIVIDTAPIGLVSDGLEVARYADATLFVIRHKTTPKIAIKYLKDIQDKKLVSNVGIIYNGMESTNKKYGYGYGYGYGHGYYNEE